MALKPFLGYNNVVGLASDPLLVSPVTESLLYMCPVLDRGVAIGMSLV